MNQGTEQESKRKGRDMTKQCAECRDGEHDNLSDDVQLAIIRDPDTGQILKRAYICDEHWSQYLDDGYTITKA